MFWSKLSRKSIQYYQNSPHRDRINLISRHLLNLRYLERVVREHIHEWLRFSRYCEDQGVDLPSSIYAQPVGDYLHWRFPKGSQSRQRFIKASLRMFIEADENGNFSRRIRPLPKSRTPLFQRWVPPYLKFLDQHRGVSVKTLRKNTHVLGEFMGFLDQFNIHNLREITADHLYKFFMNPGSRRPLTWTSWRGIIRRFLKYLFLWGELERDLSLAVGGLKHFRQSKVYDVLTEREVSQLLSSADRSSAIGRRGYAILLLSAIYGMRPSDIRKIRLEDIHWRQGQIVFRQSKTDRPLILPLLPEVLEALIDYLRRGRPESRFRNLFIRHKAPFEPFSPNNNLSRIMVGALRRTGMIHRPGLRGLYLLRHTLATRMLGKSVPLQMISSILGHTSTDSTLGYTKIDLTHLRSASLSIAEVLQ